MAGAELVGGVGPMHGMLHGGGVAAAWEGLASNMSREACAARMLCPASWKRSERPHQPVSHRQYFKAGRPRGGGAGGIKGRPKGLGTSSSATLHKESSAARGPVVPPSLSQNPDAHIPVKLSDIVEQQKQVLLEGGRVGVSEGAMRES